MAVDYPVASGRYFIHPLPEKRDDDGWYGNKFGVGKSADGSVVVTKWYPADAYFPSEALAVESALRRAEHLVRQYR